MVKQIQVSFDAHDPGRLAAFWAEALGYIIEPPPEGFSSWPKALKSWGVPESEWNSRSAIVDPSGVWPRIFFQQVPEGKATKNRVHLDIRVAPGREGEDRMAALEAECTRLETLGATRVHRIEPQGLEMGLITMIDPEGNEFCLD